MRISVLGAGAIGGWVGARLALAGHEVMALTARGPLDALELREGGEVRQARFTSFKDPPELLVVAVKATALAEAAAKAAEMIGPETLILPMLNGVPWWFANGEPLKAID